MAAIDKTSSTASTNGSSKFDVFLSFRGEDIRHNFIGFLHKALKDTGFNVFLDSKSLWTGEAIGPILLRAIEGSKISIPILSRRYAESHWCLRELAKIVQCHTSNSQLVMPIFFNVEPSHVCNQKGTFQEPFCEHEKRFEPSVLENWRNALKVVGNMEEREFIDETRDQAELIKSIVQKVKRKLISSTHLAESKYLIGIDSHVKDMESLLNIGSNDVQVVGICGLGGIGKTTIAKAVYNRNLLTFNKHSFLSNVRTQATECMGLESLQKRLLKDICKRDIDIATYHIGKTLIEHRLNKEKVLIVLDDVDNQEQVDALAGELNWFGLGSRVIITTRDEDILTMTKCVYKPQLLDLEQSLQLFSRHAFQKDQPPEDYMQLSNDVTQYSSGLPLTLKVLGSSLAKISSKKIWESKIQELREIPPEKVQRSLKISYDSLENDYQKSIFLDAACFFVGWEKETLISIWEACGYHPTSAIDRLTKRSLLKFGDESEGPSYLQMHDHIRGMGREIVLQDSRMNLGERTRLWNYDEIKEVLEDNKGTGKIKGLSLPYASSLVDSSLVDFPTESLKRMVNLRFLEISSADFKGDFSHLPSSLRCFKCTGCHWTIVPTDFYHKRLVYLNISESNIVEAWNVRPQDKNKQFQKLKVLDLNRCVSLSKSPNFSWFPHLERLDLRQCKSLDKLHSSIRRLSKLKNLILMGCVLLKKLPESIGDLKSLVELDLSDCDKLEELPDAVGLLEKLEILNAENCCKLMKLPRSMQRMRCLHSIKLERTRISNIPEDFSMLSNLVELEISCRLESFPKDLSHLNKLKQLTLHKCKKLVYLTELPSNLIELRCEECTSLVRLSDLSRLKILRKICLRGCTKLEEIAGLEGAESLEELDAQGCFKLTYTPRNTHGWGTLLHERSLEYSYSLTATADGIYNNKGLVLCLVFHIMSSSVFGCESVDFHISASIRQNDQTIWCLHTLRIEEVKFACCPHEDIIYIHHFKGFDWFGIPMEGKDAIEIHDIYGLRNQTYELRLWKLLFENREPEQLLLNQHSGAMMMMIASPPNNTEGDDQENDDTDEEEEEELEILSPPRPRRILYESRLLQENKPKEVENPFMNKAMLKDEVLSMDIRGLILDHVDDVIGLSPLSPVEELLKATATPLVEEDDDEAASPSPIDNNDEALLRAIGRIVLENDEEYEVLKAMERLLL